MRFMTFPDELIRNGVQYGYSEEHEFTVIIIIRDSMTWIVVLKSNYGSYSFVRTGTVPGTFISARFP